MQSKLRIGRLPVLGLLSMVGLLAAMFAAIPAQAQPFDYSGRAYAIGTNALRVVGIPIGNETLGDSGQLPVAGGSVSYGGPNPVVIDGFLSATVTLEQATGAAGLSSATSQIAAVTVAGILDATVLTANTAVNCGGPTTLSSSVATLTIAGASVPVPILTTPNSTYTVVNAAGLTIATIVFNRQAYDPATNKASADALVVNFPLNGPLSNVISGTLILSHAESDLTCAATPTPTPTPTATATPAPTPTPTALPGLPRTGSGPGHSGQPAPFGGTSGLLAMVVLLLISASTASTGFVLWRRRSHLTS